MTIAQIRNIIRTSSWLRNDLIGGTREEFCKLDVGPQLEAKIAQLQALEIPARFAEDIARRDEEITYCLRVIGRWIAARSGIKGGSLTNEEYEVMGAIEQRKANSFVVIEGGRA